MKILDTIPREDGFYMPAEFEKHRGCLMIWPERADSWQFGAVAARQAFVRVAEAIAESEELTMFVSYAQYDTARRMLSDSIRVVEMSSDDSWARDVAPTFVRDKAGHLRGIDWGFNAWGGLVDGLYFPWDKDQKMARKICDLYGVDVYNRRDFILEGGSIHVDGEGTAMVTERCLLSKGRNAGLTREEIEQRLKENLNVSKVLWLPYGIYRDETNEHVDNICAFVRPGEVVLAWTEDENDPQYAMSKADYEYLAAATDACGRKLKIHKLLLPKPVCMTKRECEGLIYWDDEPTRTEGERLAASYVNFYIANKAIVMPGFDDEADEKAAEKLAQLFPDRRIIQIPAREILIGGGNIHCITQQIPW